MSEESSSNVQWQKEEKSEVSNPNPTYIEEDESLEEHKPIELYNKLYHDVQEYFTPNEGEDILEFLAELKRQRRIAQVEREEKYWRWMDEFRADEEWFRAESEKFRAESERIRTESERIRAESEKRTQQIMDESKQLIPSKVEETSTMLFTGDNSHDPRTKTFTGWVDTSNVVSEDSSACIHQSLSGPSLHVSDTSAMECAVCNCVTSSCSLFRVCEGRLTKNFRWRIIPPATCAPSGGASNADGRIGAFCAVGWERRIFDPGGRV